MMLVLLLLRLTSPEFSSPLRQKVCITFEFLINVGAIEKQLVCFILTQPRTEFPGNETF
jgi:hypothetical protein